jgi:hypothetical protein
MAAGGASGEKQPTSNIARSNSGSDRTTRSPDRPCGSPSVLRHYTVDKSDEEGCILLKRLVSAGMKVDSSLRGLHKT